MIYVLQSGAAGPVKIGVTNDVRRRVAMLATGSPEPLRILRVVEGGPTEEREIHQQLADFRVRGEWFAPVPEVLAAGRNRTPVPHRGRPQESGHPFAVWRSSKNMAAHVAASAIGVSRHQLCRWELGKSDPTLAALHAIDTLTDGVVSPNDWVLWWAATRPKES